MDTATTTRPVTTKTAVATGVFFLPSSERFWWDITVYIPNYRPIHYAYFLYSALTHFTGIMLRILYYDWIIYFVVYLYYAALLELHYYMDCNIVFRETQP